MENQLNERINALITIRDSLTATGTTHERICDLEKALNALIELQIESTMQAIQQLHAMQQAAAEMQTAAIPTNGERKN